MLEEQKIHGSQFLTDSSPESIKNLHHHFSRFLKKLNLDPPNQLEWQALFQEATTHSNSSDKLVTAWTLRGDQIYLEVFHPSDPHLDLTYHHENLLSPYGMRQIISKTYKKLNKRKKPIPTTNELELASEFQKKILPLPKFPENEDWSLFTRRKSSLNVAGDYVDACLNKNGDLFLIIADVMGKGITAALLATMIRTAFDMNLESNLTLIDLVHALNHTLVRETQNLTIFATCCIAFIPFKCNTIEIVNAAHCPPLLFNGKELIRQFPASGPPLGLFENAHYTSEIFPLTKAEKLIMLTDGLYEWAYGDTSWGWQNLLKFIPQHSSSPEDLWNALQNQINATSDTMSDDQTLLVWTRKDIND